jgi:hypothetical protein
VAWMSVISLILFAWICYYLIKKNRHDPYAIAGLLLKILAGLGLGIIYTYHYKGGDTLMYFHEAATIAHYVFEHAHQTIHIYFNTAQLPELMDQMAFSTQPRALLFTKIISVFYIFSGGNYWIISAFLSLINFVCLRFLVNELSRKFAGLKKAAALSFYFLPTFVFWTSGLLKESLAIAALAIAIAVVIRFSRIQKYTNIPLWIYLFISSILLWKLKYFYAAIAIPLLFGILCFNIINSWKKVHPGLLLFLFIAGIFFVSRLHPNLGFARVLDVIYENYQVGIKASEGSAIQYFNFDGSWHSYILNFPIALFSGLFRPFISEVSNPLQFIVALENLAIFILMIITVWKVKFRVNIKNNYGISTAIYVFSLAVLLAFATPNFGTLSRYKVGYWPFFVLLLLILYFLKQKKGQTLTESDQ